MDTEKEFKKTYLLVEQILLNTPETRESDKLLCYEVYQTIARSHGKSIFIPFELFKEFPSFETISRWRRKLNENGRFLPKNPEVLKRRRKREGEVRNLMEEEL